MLTKPRLILLVAILLFVVFRYPILEHHPGIQDEQWFAIPGYTMWNEGVPRIPYLPTRIRSSFFENADVCLMALPPGLAFAQAPFFGIFEAGYPTARIPTFLAAIGIIVIAFRLAKLFEVGDFVLSMLLFVIALSRPLMFAGLTSRPDVLCIFFGLLCSLILATEFVATDRITQTTADVSTRRRYLSVAFAGLSCGLAGLCHPLAIVFAMQAGIALLFLGGGIKRMFIRLVTFGLASLVGISPWLPYIAKYTYEFRSQFMSNVLDRAGPGLFARMLWPFPSLTHHTGLLWELLGPIQLSALLLAIIFGTVYVARRFRTVPVLTKPTEAIGEDAGVHDTETSFEQRQPKRLQIFIVATFYAWSSLFLTATAAGRHPSQLYWLYAFIWCMLFGAIALDEVVHRVLALRSEQQHVAGKVYAVTSIGLVLCIAIVLPGGGFRTWLTYVTHWKDPRYHGQRFIAEVLEQIPQGAVCYVDVSYVFDVYLSGRPTILCANREGMWGDEELHYDCLLLAWEGDDGDWANHYEAMFVKQFGSQASPQNCYVDLFVPLIQLKDSTLKKPEAIN